MPDSRFACTACRAEHRWTPRIAGKAARCACGATMIVPESDPGDLYDLAPLPVEPVPVPAPTPAAPVLRYQASPAPMQAPPASAYFPDPIKDLKMPVVLLAGGLVIEFLLSWWEASHTSRSAIRVLGTMGLELVLGTGLSLIAVLFAAWRRNFQLGRFWTAVLKLSAICVAPGALMGLLFTVFGLIPFAGLIIIVVGFCFYFALIGALFDLDQSDTLYCVACIFLVNIAVLLGARWLS